MRSLSSTTRTALNQIVSTQTCCQSRKDPHSFISRLHTLNCIPRENQLLPGFVFYRKMISTQLIPVKTFSSTSGSLIAKSNQTDGSDSSSNKVKKRSEARSADYTRAIQDLNLLQTNTQVLALAKYKNPEKILPLFRKQMQIAGIQVNDLIRLNPIHVSGTKGKGSTCAFTESILRHAGLKTGFYNSPHLVKVTERIQLNGCPIHEELFAKYFRRVFDSLVEGTKRESITMPSYFSFLTILAFRIFLDEKVDCAVIEVGMGGEYDPTNVIEKPVACGITTLDFDHTNVLGNTIESIAWNKAGIIKTGAPVFTIDHEQIEATRVIETRARQQNSPLKVCTPINPDLLDLGIQSSIQYSNAALSCHLANCLLQSIPNGSHINIAEKDGKTFTENFDNLPSCFREGLQNCNWPGRCQIVNWSDKISLFLDGAHTRKSMENCLEWFTNSSQAMDLNAQQVLMVNVIGDRNKVEVLEPLTKHDKFTHVVFSTNRINTAGDTPKSETFVNLHGPNSEKSLENAKSNAQVWINLKENASDTIVLRSNVYDAMKAIEQIVLNGKQCHVLATGSLHFVGAILETLSLISDNR